MDRNTPLSAEALALIYLRGERRWKQKELAQAKGYADNRAISRYETGEIALSRAELDDMAALMGFSREDVEALLFIHSFVNPPSLAESGSPVDLTPEELRRIDRAVIADGWTRAAELRAWLIEDKKKRKAEEARREAGELWKVLRSLSARERRELVEDSLEFRSWALVERLCHESKAAAADNASKALELSNLALFVALRADGTEAWSRRLQGYAWAFIANSRRVANDQSGADSAIATAWKLWKSGEDAGLLPEWRVLSIEASLRRDERRLEEALDLLERAEKATGDDSSARANILLIKESVHEQMGDPSGALATLCAAAHAVEATPDDRLLFALRFKTAKALCALDRVAEAEELLPTVRDLAERLGNELDLVRVVWLSARVAAGRDRLAEAVSGLEQVRHDFTVLGLPYDAALASLELSLLHLKAGRTAEVKELGRQMGPIFQAQRIARETLAAFTVFHEAAQRESATVELALRAIAEVEAAKRSAPRPLNRHEERS
jgi:transcriptional regulator with XRE-family HTH domain